MSLPVTCWIDDQTSIWNAAAAVAAAMLAAFVVGVDGDRDDEDAVGWFGDAFAHCSVYCVIVDGDVAAAAAAAAAAGPNPSSLPATAEVKQSVVNCSVTIVQNNQIQTEVTCRERSHFRFFCFYLMPLLVGLFRWK